MRARGLFLVLSLCLLAGTTAARAHDLRSAYLELRQTGPETYDVLWKVPAQNIGMRLGLHVVLPEGTVKLSEPRATFTGSASVERWSVRHPGGLEGQSIGVAGPAAATTDVLVRLERLDGTTQMARLTAAAPALRLEAAQSRWQVAWAYTGLGVEHILLGIDHLLFVLGLMLLVEGVGQLIRTVTAFTIAHSITLGLATLGVVQVPPAPVEAVIALSIVFVAAEAVARAGRGPSEATGLTARQPWIVAFTFGLLHGFGFAGALSEVGLPPRAIPIALLFFNVGVELGQILFIVAVLAVVALLRRARVPHPRWAELSVPYAIGSIAMFWVIQRIAAFV